MIWYKKLFTFLSISATHVANFFLNKKKRKSRNDSTDIPERRTENNLMLPRKYPPTMIPRCLDRVLHYLTRPTYNIDICMYALSNSKIINTLLDLNSRGVIIRMIVDAHSIYVSRPAVNKLRNRGIPVMRKEFPFRVTNKFCLFDTLSDGKNTVPFIMIGTGDWTYSDLRKYCGNYLVTSEKALVDQYKKEFDRLWLN